MDNFQKPLTGPIKAEFIPRAGELVALTGTQQQWQVKNVLWFVENSEAVVNLEPYADQ